jgi:hypothetical protein
VACATIVVMQGTRFLAALGLALSLAACGSDAEDPTTRTAPPTITGPPSELVPYCEAVLALWIVIYDSVSVVHAAPLEEAIALAQSRATELQPLAGAALSEAPPGVESSLEVLVGAIDEVAVTGDISVFNSAAVQAALRELNEFNSDTCGWPVISLVTSGGSSIAGVPQQLGPGYHIFQIRNDSSRDRQVDLYLDVADDDAPPITARFPSGRLVQPEEVRLAISSVIPAGDEATQLVFLQLGTHAFVLAEPGRTTPGPRIFIGGSATSFRVVEGG